MAVGFVNMKDAGDTDGTTVGGMEGGATLGGRKQEGGHRARVCLQSLAEKQGQEDPFCLPAFCFLGRRHSGCLLREII